MSNSFRDKVDYYLLVLNSWSTCIIFVLSTFIKWTTYYVSHSSLQLLFLDFTVPVEMGEYLALKKFTLLSLIDNFLIIFHKNLHVLQNIVDETLALMKKEKSHQVRAQGLVTLLRLCKLLPDNLATHQKLIALAKEVTCLLSLFKNISFIITA